MRLKQYINEGRSVSIGEKDAAEYIKEKCTKAWYSTRIYRGNEDISDKYYFLDPSKSYERRSPFADFNFYNLLLSNLSSWKKYPKRNKSVICTTSENNARYRGRDIYYYVLPVNDANIGVCPQGDIWDSFYSSNIDLGNFGNELSEFFDSNNIDISDDDYIEFVDACKKIDQYKKEENLNLYSVSQDWLLKFEHKNMSFLDYINEILSPSKNNFRLIKIGKDIDSNREVWTDSKCILVRYDQTQIGLLLQAQEPIEMLDKIK